MTTEINNILNIDNTDIESDTSMEAFESTSVTSSVSTTETTIQTPTMKFSLTSEPKSTCLDKLTLCETIPKELLKKLINSTLLKQTFHKPFSAFCFENEKEQLSKLFKMIKQILYITLPKGRLLVGYHQKVHYVYLVCEGKYAIH